MTFKIIENDDKAVYIIFTVIIIKKILNPVTKISYTIYAISKGRINFFAPIYLKKAKKQ